jgi:hypothetical protein
MKKPDGCNSMSLSTPLSNTSLSQIFFNRSPSIFLPLNLSAFFYRMPAGIISDTTEEFSRVKGFDVTMLPVRIVN